LQREQIADGGHAQALETREGDAGERLHHSSSLDFIQLKSFP
jgi:hypothetical protein